MGGGKIKDKSNQITETLYEIRMTDLINTWKIWTQTQKKTNITEIYVKGNKYKTYRKKYLIYNKKE